MSIKANSKLSSPAFSRRIGKIVEEISEDGLTPQCAFSLEKKKENKRTGRHVESRAIRAPLVFFVLQPPSRRRERILHTEDTIKITANKFTRKTSLSPTKSSFLPSFLPSFLLAFYSPSPRVHLHPHYPPDFHVHPLKLDFVLASSQPHGRCSPR